MELWQLRGFESVCAAPAGLWWTLSSCSFHPSPPTRRMSAQLLFNYAKNPPQPAARPSDWPLYTCGAFQPRKFARLQARQWWIRVLSQRRDALWPLYGPAATDSLSAIALPIQLPKSDISISNARVTNTAPSRYTHQSFWNPKSHQKVMQIFNVKLL